MAGSRPSLSARAVALTRAGLDRPSTPEGDPAADVALAHALGRARLVSRGPLFEYLAARTAFVDDAVLRAIWSGCRQVVIVGAGYDGRALRFRSPGVRFFELDHPVTQADKRARLSSLGVDDHDVSFASVDFTVGDAGAALEVAGHDPDQDTLYVCEGVVLYLTPPVVEHLLSSLRRRATSASRLALNMPLRPPGRGALRWRRRLLDGALASLGEPPRLRLARVEALDLVESGGWAPLRVVDPADLNPRARPGHVLLIEAGPTPQVDPGEQDGSPDPDG